MYCVAKCLKLLWQIPSRIIFAFKIDHTDYARRVQNNSRMYGHIECKYT